MLAVKIDVDFDCYSYKPNQFLTSHAMAWYMETSLQVDSMAVHGNAREINVCKSFVQFIFEVYVRIPTEAGTKPIFSKLNKRSGRTYSSS